MRLLLTLLALAAVLLAIAFNTWWLFVLAGLIVLAAIGAWGMSLWEGYKKTTTKEKARSSTRDELAALGIMEIREKKEERRAREQEAREKNGARPADSPKPIPKKQDAGVGSSEEDEISETSSKVVRKESSREVSSESSSSVTETTSSQSDEERSRVSGSSPHSASAKTTDQVQEPPDETSEIVEPASTSNDNNGQTSNVDRNLVDILAPYLESLRAATGTQTAALLVQDEVDISYRVQAIASSLSNTLPAGGQFESTTPLLTASLSRQPASIRLIGSDLDEEALGYYISGSGRVQELGLAPVSRPNHPATFFLVIDTPETFDWKRDQRLLARYADLLAVILNTYDSDGEVDESQDGEATRQVDRDDLPPRRQVIAEEMERARGQDTELALAILYLNRAESIASKGDKAVARAERALYRWLEKMAPECRIEPFGELTYGVFFEGAVAEAEAWAVRIQEKSEQAPSPLEGGVSIGLSMLRPRHQSPDALRSDATEALREAYTTGTCTILE